MQYNSKHLREDFEEIDKYKMGQIDLIMNMVFQNCYHKTTILNISYWIMLFSSVSIIISGNTQYGFQVTMASSGDQNPINTFGRYVIVVGDQVPPDELREIGNALEERGARITHKYSHSLNGFAIEINSDKESEVLDYLRSDNRVVSIEPEKTMTLPFMPSR